jgi:hypothetical protein
MESEAGFQLPESSAEDLAELDRLLAARATRYFWVEGGTEYGLGEFHYHVDCPEITVEGAWGATLVTSDAPPLTAWWHGDARPSGAKRVLCAFCLGRGPSTEPCLDTGRGPACATCGCGQSFHEGEFEMFRGIFDHGCGMAWADPVDALAFQSHWLHHCRCNGYRPASPDAPAEVTSQEAGPSRSMTDHLAELGEADRTTAAMCRD